MVRAVTSQQEEGPGFYSWIGITQDSSGCFGLLSQSKNMHVRLLDEAKLTVGVNGYLSCLFLCCHGNLSRVGFSYCIVATVVATYIVAYFCN